MGKYPELPTFYSQGKNLQIFVSEYSLQTAVKALYDTNFFTMNVTNTSDFLSETFT